MASVVITSETTGGPFKESTRHLDTTSSPAVLWTTLHSINDNRLEFWYSTNGGATWTEDTVARITVPTGGVNGMGWFIDADDFAHILYVEISGSTYSLRYRRGTPNGGRTAWTWSSVFTVESDTTYFRANLDTIAHAEGTGWKVHASMSRSAQAGGNSYARYIRLNITSGGTVSIDANTTIDSNAVSGLTATSIDFDHNGNGKTPGNKHVYMAWINPGTGDSLKFCKIAYSAGVWTPGTVRVIHSGTNDRAPALLFDGTRVIMAVEDDPGTSVVRVFERDVADTTTTERTLPSSPGTDLLDPALTYFSNGDMLVVARELSSKDLYSTTYNRAGNSWSAWAQLEARNDARQPSFLRGKRLLVFTEDTTVPNIEIRFEGALALVNLEAGFQGVATLTPGLGLTAAVEGAFQGVGTLSGQATYAAALAAAFQGVGRLTSEMEGVPALDFTVYDLYIDEGTDVVGYIVHEDDQTKGTTRANPTRAEKQDVGQNPFEQRPEFGDPFAQGDFSHGADQTYFHHVGRDEKKFLASEGFNISEPGVLTHLRVIAEAVDSTTIGATTQAGGLVFVADGTNVKRGNGAFPGVWTNESPHVAEGAVNVLDLTSRGAEIFAALGVNGVHIRSSAGVWSHFQPDGSTNLSVGTATRLAWLKDRLFVVGQAGRSIYEVVSSSSPTAIKNIPEGWTFELIFEAGAYVYATAVNPDAGLSRVHIFGLNSAGSAVEDKGSVPIPRGELIYSGIGTVGQVFLGGGKLNTSGGYNPVFYQAVQADNGFLQLLKIAEGKADANNCSVLAFEDLGHSIVFGWSLGSTALTGARAGVGIYHLGRGAFSHHLKKTGAASNRVLDIIFYKGRLMFSLESDGLYYEDTSTYVDEAYLISSIGDWSSAGLKVWDLLEVAHKALPSGTKVNVDSTTKHPEENEWSQVISNTVLNSLGANNRLSNLKSRLFAVKLRSFAAAGGGTAPTIQSFSVRSNPTRPQPEFVLTRFLRVLAKDRKDGRAPEVYQDPVTRRIALQKLLDSWVTVYEPGITWTAFVRDVSDAEPAEPFLSATSGERLKEAYLVRVDLVGVGDAS